MAETEKKEMSAEEAKKRKLIIFIGLAVMLLVVILVASSMPSNRTKKEYKKGYKTLAGNTYENVIFYFDYGDSIEKMGKVICVYYSQKYNSQFIRFYQYDSKKNNSLNFRVFTGAAKNKYLIKENDPALNSSIRSCTQSEINK